jgi:hypothetical protein
VYINCTECEEKTKEFVRRLEYGDGIFGNAKTRGMNEEEEGRGKKLLRGYGAMMRNGGRRWRSRRKGELDESNGAMEGGGSQKRGDEEKEEKKEEDKND